jgi:hypothetical protein
MATTLNSSITDLSIEKLERLGSENTPRPEKPPRRTTENNQQDKRDFKDYI